MKQEENELMFTPNVVRNLNLMEYLAYGGDYDLLERSAYFAEVRYPKVRRFTDGTKPEGQQKQGR